MSRYILWFLRGIAVAAFIVFATLILINVDPVVWRIDGGAGVFTALVEFAGALRNGISLVVSLFIYVVAGIGAMAGSFFTQQPFIIIFPEYLDAVGAFFQAFGVIFLPLNPIVVQNTIISLLVSLYFLGFWLLLILGLLTGIFSFLRSSSRLATLCFVSMIGIAIVAAGGSVLNLPGGAFGYFLAPYSALPLPVNANLFLLSPVFVVALMSFVYLEASYQVVYFSALLEPPTLREEQLRKQLQQLQSDAQTQIPIRSRDVPVPKALQRMLGSDAFRLMRQVIERKLLRREWLVELKDAHEVRRLNSFVQRLFREDPDAEAALTARASSPSVARMVWLSIGSSLVRFMFVILIAYLCVHPVVLLNLIQAPPIIVDSIEFLYLHERTLMFLVPLALLFPLISGIIGYLRQRRRQSEEQPTMS
ncbi:MAG: hypothetical protein ACFE89_07100 [Candidatus Hodarchaeota archaeon]